MKRVFVLLLVLMLAPLSFTAICHGAGESDARAAVAEAQQRTNTCYGVAADAAKTSANVTGLLSTLSSAGVFLSKAELALQKGDFDGASTSALQCDESLTGFEAVASGLKDSAVKASNLDFAVNVVGSSVGAVAVAVLGFVVWRLLRKRYPGVS
jgi:hypothetical protein